MDQSGSVGYDNYELATKFTLQLVDYFTIGPTKTRVGFVAFSTSSHLEFDLNEHSTKEDVLEDIRGIYYRRGWTATALGLNTTAYILNPENNHGARDASEGVPKIAVLITDGKSNRGSLTYAVPNLKRTGAQIYCIGIANPDVDELRLISSDPDREYVFLLDTFDDAAGFVNFLSAQTCQSKFFRSRQLELSYKHVYTL